MVLSEPSKKLVNHAIQKKTEIIWNGFQRCTLNIRAMRKF